MHRIIPVFCVASSFMVAVAQGIDWPQWRGPDRTGVSPETGLLKAWPQDGPTLAWEAGGIGEGYSSVSIAAGRIFTMGDSEGSSHVYALNKSDGSALWSLHVGKSGGNYAGTRCTPTVDGDFVYALGQFGDLVCIEAASGRERWRKSLPADFGGKVGGWNYCESPLIDGEKLIIAPGGPDATVVALNKQSGEVIWKTALPGRDRAEYSSFVITQAAGIKQYVGLLSGGTVGIAADDGRFLWQYERLGRNTANIPTPIVFDDYVFTTAGYGKGGALLKLSASGSTVEAQEVYYNSKLKNKHGGVVKVGNYIYGDLDSSGKPWCADVMTGEVKWSMSRSSNSEGNGSACVTFADGRLYVRFQNSIMALVDGSPDGEYTEVGSFKIPDDMSHSWAHPVVCDGRLYLRGKGKLLCYDIADQTASIEPRTWTDATGQFTVQATFVSLTGDKVDLRRTDGQMITVPLSRLSAPDQAYVRSLDR